MSQALREVNPFEDGSASAALRGLPGFEEALARMLHTAEHGRPFGIVRGPAGAGKTQLLSCIAAEMRQCCQLDLRRSSASEFVEQLCHELGVICSIPAACWRSVEDVLLGRAHAARPTLLLLDHLEAADTELLGQLERLLAVAHSSAGWCSVLAAGQTPSAAVDAFATRHGELRIDLGRFNHDETAQFLEQVVTSSGCRPFTSEAVAAIHDSTGGLLRDIVRLGRLVLFALSTEGGDTVTSESVWMIAGEVASPRSTALPHHRTPARKPTEVDALSADF